MPRTRGGSRFAYYLRSRNRWGVGESHPLASLGRRYAEAVAVPEAPSPVRTLADMIAAPEKQLGAPVVRGPRQPRSQQPPDHS